MPASAQVPLQHTPEAAVGDGGSAELAARLEAKRKVAMIAEVVSELEMEVLTLHLVEELSVKEIARVVGRSQRAVDSLLYRAKRKARERLEQDGE